MKKIIILSLIIILTIGFILFGGNTLNEKFVQLDKEKTQSHCSPNVDLGTDGTFYNSPTYWEPRIPDKEYSSRSPPYFYEGNYGFNLWKRPTYDIKKLIN